MSFLGELATSRRRTVLVLIGLLAACHAATFLGSGPFDDDFIIYRYAQNWIEGRGLVFNSGERIEGFSAPLWVIVIALGLTAHVAAPLASSVVSIAAAAFAVLAIGLTWQRRRPQTRVFAPALMLALSPAFAWHAVAGLGTTLLAALLAGWLLCYERSIESGKSTRQAALLLGLAGLLRAEAVLWALPFAWLELRRRRTASALLTVLPLAAWTIFRRVYYGRWLPVTYALKKLSFFDDVRYGAHDLLASTLASGIGILVVLAFLGWLRESSQAARESRSTALWCAALGLCLHTLYVVYVGGDFMPLARFFMPALPIAWLLACLALTGLTQARPRFAASLGCAAGLALQWPQFQVRTALFERHAAEEVRWEKLGRDFRRRMPQGTSVALAPIGAFGYYSRLPIVDILGLTNDVILRAEPDLTITMKGHHRYDARYVLARRPVVIILGNGELEFSSSGRPRLVISAWERTLAEHSDFQRDYVPMRVEIEGSYPLIFYLRRDAPVPSGATRA